MAESDLALQRLVAGVALALGQQKHCLAVAESCTGGGLAAALTSLAGSSAWFERGFVTYSNEAKQELLGVPATTIERHGAVSEATARAMAGGALAHSRANWAVAITGIAGPTGGSVDKPVGTVCFAWAYGKADEVGGCEAMTVRFDGDRTEVRASAVRYALAGLLDRVVNTPVIA